MNLAPAIILIIVAAVVGYVLGLIDSRLTASVRNKLEENTTASTAAADQSVVEDRNKLGEHTVLKVTIDQTLKWHLELDKVRLENPSEMSSDQRQRMLNLVAQIRPWIDGKEVQTSAPLPTPQPIPELPPLKMPRPAIAAQTPIPNVSGPRIDPLRGLRSLLNNDVKVPNKPQGVSIVMMIDEVLQARLLGTSLLSKGIRLEEGSMGEVIVFVGRERYDGVDAVPDPEIRAIIKTSISDWEKK